MDIITTNMLTEFLQSNKRLFEEVLPELIKRLIIAESDPDTIRIPTHSDIWVPGFDGVVVLRRKTRHVNRGTTYWEFGTQVDYFRKIKSDYEKRTNETPEETRKKTTLYLVTPYIWTRKESIIEWQSNRSEWKKTVVYDGVAIVDWINSEPAVCAWLISKFNCLKMDFSSVTQSWDSFASYTSPSLVASMFLYDRDENKERLLSLIQEERIIKVKADFFMDALGFVLASLCSDCHLREMTIVVNDYETYMAIANMVSNKIILLNFYCNKNLFNNNHTILCYGKTAYSIKADISLPTRQRRHVEFALKEMGFSQSESSELYHKTHGNLRALIRQIPGTANYVSPEWTQANDLNLLYPLLFLESINRTNDRELVEALSSVKYEIIEEKYKSLTRIEDSPVKEISGYFVIVNFEEVWDYLCPSPEDMQFQRLVDVIYSALFCKTTYSAYHRRTSIVQQLLTILVWYSYEHSSSNVFVNTINKLLSERSYEHKVIYDNLHIIAEALPEATLKALETDVNDQQSYLYHALNNNDYTSILMALEELTLNESTAYQSCILLHKLAQINKEYLYSNNPYNSLSSALSMLNVYSALSTNDKKLLLKNFIEHDGKWGSKFASDVITTDHFYRSERIGKKERNVYTSLTYGMYYDAINELSICIVHKCNELSYIDPIINLISHYWLYYPERLIDLANAFQIASFLTEDVVRINHSLRRKLCLLEKNEKRQGYTQSLLKWIECTTNNDPVLKWAWAFVQYYDCPDISLVDCYADIDNGETYKFRKSILAAIKKENANAQISQLSFFMEDAYGWGRVISSLSDNSVLVDFCHKARDLKKYSLLAGVMDHLGLGDFMCVFTGLNQIERKNVLPCICRRDFLNESLSEEDMVSYWSRKTMRQFDENDYKEYLKYNPYGLLYYCKNELEDGAEMMINTISEVLYSIAEHEQKWSYHNQWKDLVEEIINCVDRIYYSQEWALLCMKLQNLSLLHENSDGINRYLFENPQVLIMKYHGNFGYYNLFRLPFSSYLNYVDFRDFLDFLISQGENHFASQILSRTLIDDKELPIFVMEYLEDYCNLEFDKEIASCIVSSRGFTWTYDGRTQREKAEKYKTISNNIDSNHYHTKVVFSTLSYIYDKESHNEDIEGEIFC